MIRLKRLQCNLATPTAVCKEVLKSMSILTQTAGGPQRTMDVNSPIVQLIHWADNILYLELISAEETWLQFAVQVYWGFPEGHFLK